MNKLLENCIEIARRAGDAVMDVYMSEDFGVETKTDGDYKSPLTKADKEAHKIIEKSLKEVSDLPIISEEGNHKTKADKFWLVDPLDGTKEFINKNGEFTVNIALVEKGEPILGVVYAPAKNVLYAGAKYLGAYKIENDKSDDIKSVFRGDKPIVVASRSHRDKKMDKFLKTIGEHKEINMGSSLKLCLVAEGRAQIYPRFAPTMIWDTAAADAIVRVAGGRVENLQGRLLKYEPEKTLKNPFFIVKANVSDN